MNWSTAISSIGSSISSVARSVTPAVQSLLPSFAPLISSALMPAPRTAHYAGGGGGMAGFMPGAPGIRLPTMPGGAMAGLPGMTYAGGPVSNLGSAAYNYLTGGGGGGACITPRQVGPFMRYPRVVQFQNESDPLKIETYVRAPRVRYRVSVSRAGRCRAGGR